MPKKKTKEPLVVLADFTKGIKRLEMKSGFVTLVKTEGIAGPKTMQEWNKLLALFESRPVGTPWKEWVNQGGK